MGKLVPGLFCGFHNPGKKPIPPPSECTGMQTFRGVPNKYLYAACLVSSFILFVMGGMAFSQSMYYGVAFNIIGVFLFFAAVYFGKQNSAMV